jgi:hypothetical protein
LVGRDAEVRARDALVDGLEFGRGGLVLVTGDAGDRQSPPDGDQSRYVDRDDLRLARGLDLLQFTGGAIAEHILY